MKRFAVLLACLMSALGVFGCDSPSTDDPGREIATDGGERGGPRDFGPRSQDSGVRRFDADVRGPALNSVFPNRGPIGGGTEVRFVGRDFAEGMAALIGEQPCVDLIVENENHARCTTPPVDAAAVVDTRIELVAGGEPGLIEGGFTYFVEVEAGQIDPSRGTTRGGFEVRIFGAGFIEPTEVRFGGRRAPQVVVESGEVLVVTVPPGAAGAVDISVGNVNGQAVLEGAFVYTESLVLESVSPPYGWVAGGDEITLIGGGLDEGSEVLFGEVPAVVVESMLGRQRLRVFSPAADGPGPVDLTVRNANGEITLRGNFMYLAADTGDLRADGVAPSRLSTLGGETFHVGGGGFAEGTRVRLDGQFVPCTVDQPERLSCVSPAHARGAAQLEIVLDEQVVEVPGGLFFYAAIDIFDASPGRGAIAGGAVVELVGRGFQPGMAAILDGVAAEVLFVDESGESALIRVPPGVPGWVDLVLATADDAGFLPEAFEYFDPSTRYGGVWGDPIQWAINAAVYDAISGLPVEDALVVVSTLDRDERWSNRTNLSGQATVSAAELAGPVSVTAVKPGYEAYTFDRVTSENITLYLVPHSPPPPPMGNGAPPEPPPPSRLTGRVVGLDQLDKPQEPGLMLVAVVETTHSSEFNKAGLPYPEPRGVLVEDGAFDIFSRSGQLAVVVTAGIVTVLAYGDYQAGSIDFRQFRRELTPVAMGVQPYLSVSPGAVIQDLLVSIDRPLDMTATVTFVNPAQPFVGLASTYDVRPYLDFGAEGFYELDAGVSGGEPQLLMPYVPDLERGWEPTIQLELMGLSRLGNNVGSGSYAVSWITTRTPAAGIDFEPIVGIADLINPVDLGNLGPDRIIEWSLRDGTDGPAEPPDVVVLSIRGGDGNPLWSHVLPGGLNRYQLPQLIDDLIGVLEPEDSMVLTVQPMLMWTPFDYADFTYLDLGFRARQSYSVTQAAFYR